MNIWQLKNYIKDLPDDMESDFMYMDERVGEYVSIQYIQEYYKNIPETKFHL